VTPRLGLAIAAQHGSYTGLTGPAPMPLPFAAQLGPVRDGMRGAVTGGTATRLSGLPLAAGAKTGTAQDGGLSSADYDNWISAVAPMDAPEIVMTAWVQGPGIGGNSATGVVADGLRYYAGHRARILATSPVRTP
jgi:membrane peptidoglycan carboxypeptidase